jgi:hypothetical protein
MVLPSKPNYQSKSQIREEAKRLWQRIEEYYSIWGHYPWDPKGRANRAEYQFEASAKQQAEDRAAFIRARAQLAGEARRRDEYRNLGAFGGFEQRAADAVARVPRDKPERIINYGEVYHESLDPDDPLDNEGWVVVDQEDFGPFSSGRQGRNQLESGPYSSANPECADPQVQDRAYSWFRERQLDDAAHQRIPLGSSYLHYDDKAPCHVCNRNLQQQASFEKIFIDLFLPESADEQRGRYSGARYRRSFEPRLAVGPLASRAGISRQNLIANVERDIAKLERDSAELIREINKKMKTAHQLQINRTPLGGINASINALMQKLGDKGRHIQRLRNKLAEIKLWPE